MKVFLLLSLPLSVSLALGGGAVGSYGNSHAARRRAFKAEAASEKRASIADSGAVGDGRTLNTGRIQSAIDRLASEGGGTLVVPRGVFLTGAIFLKPGVNLHLDEGAVLKGSTDRKDYPKRETRVEGHFEEWLPALVNADRVDHLRITGTGTLDGSGAPFWEDFWARRKQNPKTTNLDVERPRLALIQNSEDVRVSGVTFKDSGFWNLHLYRCRNVVVENVRFRVPDGVRCPSTDGTDIDSCQNVTIRGCTYRVDDDCIALKGSKGPLAAGDKDSPPVEHIRVENCTFERGHGVVTLGSEATLVRDVEVKNIKVVGP
ncbi:MAG TPA: glycosyl hydrolase family 28 protein, partial [Pyrinomonadaceae bacterium]|nr:glycosyl hydrolase family 28 protein [Pyrinomonadaceae bacterium]